LSLLKLDTVIIVTPGFPKDEYDTTCLPFVQQFARALKYNFPDHQFIFISLQYPFKQGLYKWNDMDIYAIGGRNKKHIFGLRTKRLALQKLNELNEIVNIKGIISLWCIDTAMIANKFSSENNIPHVIWIIGQDAKQSNGFVKKIKPLPEQLVAMSDFLKEEFERNHHVEPKHVITNGISPEAFESLNVYSRPIDILGAGSLIPLKNYTLFIEVITELVKFYPNLNVKIAGDGPEKMLLNNLIHKYNLQNTIELLGTKSHQETLGLMNQSKFFLHTSNYEGNSTVLIEALYNGCRVVSTQRLSDSAVKNLYIQEHLQGLTDCLKNLLKNNISPERVIFNTMESSARQMMDLLG